MTLSPPKPMYGGSVDYDGSVTVQVTPNGDNLRDHRIVIGNVVPDSKLTTGSFIAAGEPEGSMRTYNTHSVHMYIQRTYVHMVYICTHGIHMYTRRTYVHTAYICTHSVHMYTQNTYVHGVHTYVHTVYICTHSVHMYI